MVLLTTPKADQEESVDDAEVIAPMSAPAEVPAGKNATADGNDHEQRERDSLGLN